MLLVQKFGGTSVGSIDRIRNVARIIKSESERGNRIVAVVSAMAGVTNQLVALGKNFTSSHSYLGKRESDVIASTGETVSSALLSLALQDIGVRARSFQGWQIGINTDSNFSEAEIKNINGKKIRDLLKDGVILVITGFQGICNGIYNGDITTLGRGGSDTSAVAIAAAIGADRCDIYTDVDGIYSIDPDIIPEAEKLDFISYNEMIEMSYQGAKVLHPIAAELALKNGLNLRILSSFIENEGTSVVNQNNLIMPRNRFIGISVKQNVCLLKKSASSYVTPFNRLIAEDFGKFISYENSRSKEVLDSIDSKHISGIRPYLVKISIIGMQIKNDEKTIEEATEKAFKIFKDHVITIIEFSVTDNAMVFFIEGDYIDVTRSLHKNFVLSEPSE
jgi:aspartate kinase